MRLQRAAAIEVLQGQLLSFLGSLDDLKDQVQNSRVDLVNAIDAKLGGLPRVV